MGTQPYNPVAMDGTQPQSPVVINPGQPQATAPMQVYSKVYGDHGANMHPIGPDGKRGWTYGLMSCSDRCGLYCCATWCPCVVYSKTRQRLRSLQYQGHPLAGGGDRYSDHCCIYTALLFIGHPWIMQVQPRAEIRERYAIRGNIINDWLASLCCNPCALTQERREVEVEEASFQAVQHVLQVDEK
jgi:Cys-rich protein (TIGR01571 family)